MITIFKIDPLKRCVILVSGFYMTIGGRNATDTESYRPKGGVVWGGGLVYMLFVIVLMFSVVWAIHQHSQRPVVGGVDQTSQERWEGV